MLSTHHSSAGCFERSQRLHDHDSRLATDVRRGVAEEQDASAGVLLEFDVDNVQGSVTSNGVTQFPQGSVPLIIAPASTLFPGTALIGATDGTYRRVSTAKARLQHWARSDGPRIPLVCIVRTLGMTPCQVTRRLHALECTIARPCDAISNNPCLGAEAHVHF